MTEKDEKLIVKEDLALKPHRTQQVTKGNKLVGSGDS